MKVLTLATQKGGSGKTTIATSLVVAASQEGETVVAVDTDPQGSLRKWGQRRFTDDITVESCGTVQSLRSKLDQLGRDGRTSLVVIDTPGTISPGVTLAFQLTDFVLIPARPSMIDIEALEPLVQQIKTLGKRYAFVLNGIVLSSPGRVIEAAQALAEMGELIPTPIASRVDFDDASMTGQGITESAPNGRSAGEIRDVWAWIKKEIA